MKYLVEVEGQIVVDTDALDYRQYVSDKKGLLPKGNRDENSNEYWLRRYARHRIQLKVFVTDKKE